MNIDDANSLDMRWLQFLSLSIPQTVDVSCNKCIWFLEGIEISVIQWDVIP